jgi:membrane protease YdiL (CAAX protease family)
MRWADVAAVLFALAFPTLLTWVYFVFLPGCAPGLQQPAYAVGKTIQFVFPVVWVLAIQRRRLAWSRPRAAGVGEGFLFGLAVLAAAMGLYYAWLRPAGVLQAAGGEIQEKVAGFGVHGIAAYVALGAFYAVIHSFLEEYYWRWFVFGQLRALMPWGAAVALSSVGFMAHHVILLETYFGWSPVTYVFSLSVAVGGAFWAWLYQRSHSLYGPWISHLLIDAAIFAVGYDLVRPLLR